MSGTRSISSNPCQRPGRSRSSSVTESTSPDSTSSDSHSSSDRDTHLSSLSPWLQTPHATNSKAAFGMDIDAVSNPHMMDLDSEMSFESPIHDLQALNTFQSGNLSFDDIVLSHASSNTKSDMLMLEEIIKDGAFDPAPPTISPFSLYHPISPISRECFIPSSTVMLQESGPQSKPQSPPSEVCIDPSSTQSQPQQPLPTVEQSSASESVSVTCKAESADVLTAAPIAQATEFVDNSTLKHEPCADSHQSPPYGAFPLISSNVVYPPQDACLDLPIFFPSVPMAGTKSRVETQIKLSFELCIPASPSSSFPSSSSQGLSLDTSSSRHSSSSSSCSNSTSTSPPLHSKDLPPGADDKPQQVTHDKVGTYKFLLLPQGTTTKRRSVNSSGAKREPKLCDSQETLQMTADVLCCSPPYASVQSCASCQSREAKRTARKVAARVRPPPSARPKPKAKGTGKKSTRKAKDQEEPPLEEEDVDIEEPNVDGSILQFNCAELVNFSGGAVVLPLRITCYCRHHKEKIGFNVVFTLRDYMGRIVGRGITPPILITDDHKSTNAVSKLPPMHPLRQALTPSTPVAPSPLSHFDETPPTTPPDQTDRAPTDRAPDRAPTKRQHVDTGVKKRRPKPYDGRPTSRTVCIGPGIEGRQGVVLALHPAHARSQASSQSATLAGPISPGPSTEGGGSPSSRLSSASVTRSPTPSRHDASLLAASSSVNGMFTLSSDTSMSTLGAETSVSSASPRPMFQSTVTSSSSSLSLSPFSHDLHALPQPQALLDLQSQTQKHQPVFNTASFPIYPTVPFPSDPLPPPKIHRLIPSSGPMTGGIEITVLGSNFHASLPLECVFGGAIASSTHRWSDNTLVCVLPPRATPGLVSVEFTSTTKEAGTDDGGSCLFTYVDESDRQLMELALQVVGLKMTGKIEDARNVAMRIVGTTGTQSPVMSARELTQMNTLSGKPFVHHSFLGSLSGVDLEILIIKLLTLLDVPMKDGSSSLSSLRAIDHKNATGQTLLHLAVLLALPSLVSCLVGRSIDIDACNHSGLTALHLAALIGWKEGAQILIAEGADVNIVDSMGLTPAERAKLGRYEELEALLRVHSHAVFSASESGDDGDDEARNSGDNESEYGTSDESSPSWSGPSQYLARSRIASSPESDSSSDEHSKSESKQEKTGNQPRVPQSDGSPENIGETVKEKLDGKQDASFVERLQRTLPQGIIPNMQIPGFPQLQLPDKLVAPWGALPQIPVFPILVPIPNLPHLPNWPGFPWPDALSGDKKENRADDETAGEKQQQPSLAMLWTAYDSLANNAWWAQWEKWTAQVTALQNADNGGAELPPYSPRREEQTKAVLPNSIPASNDGCLSSIPGVAVTEEAPGTSTSRLSRSKSSRRVVYGAVNVSETEVDSYHYPAKKQVQKQDRMLVLFWIPILFLGLAYAVYTILPAAFAGLSRAARRMLPQPLQRGQV